MCRWFAYISDTEPCLLEDVLIVPAHSLSKQVHDHYLPKLMHHEPDEDPKATEREITMRNRMFNADGLGMVWYTNTREAYDECVGPRPVMYKVLSQPTTDPIFNSICAHTSTLTLFAHIRAASPSSPITLYNAHPFTFGRWTFMHNGGVSNFEVGAVKREVVARLSEEAMERVKGTTDSEHLAGLFFTMMEEQNGGGASVWDDEHPLENVKKALESAIAKIIEIQKRVLSQKGIPFEASSLNVAITDGNQLLAIRFRNHPTQHPPSLYFSTTAGIALNRKYPGHPDMEGDGGAKAVEEHGNHVIVASEPTTFKKDDWELIDKNECLMVGKDMVVKRGKVDVQF
ncbi:hypothetical protein JAAARDRAFT_160703 [Jaapia argillacea MUCL 33604]|uniref:Glutamine amidotransferase type-2 domain-containing protein n=1 Tax=Jaapia argillacea MUCL 33604 TaxID=933084 RepID=A0A067PI85_9AGAM|nr:hypothetical protein JAAARDRAFT_160703 [Jaapia argillacea MUCL 33604]